MNNFVIGNGIVLDGMNTFVENGAVFISDGKIEKIGSFEKSRFPDVDFIDVGGRLIMPGFLNPHHHLYSSLAVGLAPAGDVDNFVNLLKSLWWKLDASLDEESVYVSAMVGIIDSVKHGVTTIFDHHASMNFVRGSLNTISKAFEIAGIKGLLCFETSDRMGIADAERHIEENIDFFERHRNNRNIKGAFGMHANFTLSEETLNKIADRKPEDMPIHIHCGEDFYDFQYCREFGYSGPVDRLDRYELIDDKSILAHAIHLSERDYDIIGEKRPIVVSNPESNANNRVGKIDRDRIKNFILGTDGMSGDMIATLRSFYLLHGGIDEDFSEMQKSFFAQRYLVQRKFFSETGEFREGMDADVVVVDYVPATEISPENVMGHLIFGAKSSKAYLTISNGKIIYRDGKITFIDEDVFVKEAKKTAGALWKKFFDK